MDGSERYGVHALPSVQGVPTSSGRWWRAEVTGGRGLAAHSGFVYGGINPPGAEVTGRSAAW